MLPEWTLTWLDSPWLPYLVFGGVMADAIIGVGFFVYGEIFFLLAGVMLAGDAGLSLLVGVWLSAWAGDLISYQLGASFGKPLLYSTLRRSWTLRKQSYKAMQTLNRKGHWAVLAARFMGPISWITPFLAGASKLTPARFACFSLAGVILASAQFIAAGYLLANGQNLYEQAVIYIKAYPMPVFFVLLSLVLSAFLIRKFIKQPNKQLHKLLSKLGIVWIASFGFMNYGYFFISNAHSALPVDSVISIDTKDMAALKKETLKVYAGDPALNKAQPVNLILITRQSLTAIHEQINWVQNETFSGDNISFFEYLTLIVRGKPPVSDLYFQGAPQNHAFQATSNSNLINREHIRWWKAGQTMDGREIFLGAVSRDHEVEIKPYKGIVTLLHDIDRNVDQSRDEFAALIKQANPTAIVTEETIGTRIAQDSYEEDYWSDGRVTVIRL